MSQKSAHSGRPKAGCNDGDGNEASDKPNKTLAAQGSRSDPGPVPIPTLQKYRRECVGTTYVRQFGATAQDG